MEGGRALALFVDDSSVIVRIKDFRALVVKRGEANVEVPLVVILYAAFLSSTAIGDFESCQRGRQARRGREG